MGTKQSKDKSDKLIVTSLKATLSQGEKGKTKIVTCNKREITELVFKHLKKVNLVILIEEKPL